MSKGILYVVELKIFEGKEKELRELAQEMVESTAKEPGTIHYHWSINGGTCHTIEHYESNEATLAHLNHFNATFSERYMSVGAVASCTVYGEPNKDVTRVLDGFGSVYMTTIASFSR